MEETFQRDASSSATACVSVAEPSDVQVVYKFNALVLCFL